MSSHTDLNVEGLSNHELASQVISKYTGKSSSANNNKRKSQNVVKDDNEYMKKRARNNVAVKKSREKAKNRIQDTQIRVEQLSKENEELQTKVNLLSKELNVLRALFTNGGFTLPSELQCGGSPPPSEHSMPPSMSSYHGRLSSDDGPPSLPKTSPLHSSYMMKNQRIIHQWMKILSTARSHHSVLCLVTQVVRYYHPAIAAFHLRTHLWVIIRNVCTCLQNQNILLQRLLQKKKDHQDLHF